MSLLVIAVAALLSGLGVVLATGLARRIRGPAAGIAAALPVTPTLAILALGIPADPTLLKGLSSILGAMLLLALLLPLTALTPTTHPWKVLLLVPLLAALLLATVPWGVQLIGIVLLAFLLMPTVLHAMQGALATRRSIPGWGRFLCGAGAVLAVAAAQHLFPPFASMVALLPVLFVAAVLTAGSDGGAVSARRVAAGGIPGSMAVAGFVVVVASTGPALGTVPAVVLGWAGYLLVAGFFLWMLSPRTLDRSEGAAPYLSGSRL